MPLICSWQCNTANGKFHRDYRLIELRLRKLVWKPVAISIECNETMTFVEQDLQIKKTKKDRRIGVKIRLY